MSDADVLVIGATGMLGSQVVDRLMARGKRVRALVRPTSQTEKLVAAGVELAPGDLLAPETLLRALDGVDAVVSDVGRGQVTAVANTRNDASWWSRRTA